MASLDGATAGFWSLVYQRHLRVNVSRAVLVDGGLSPPPSKIYPGTKCYMVTVTVDGRNDIGFGPSRSIAQLSAIREAYSYLRSREMEVPDTGLLPHPYPQALPHPQKASSPQKAFTRPHFLPCLQEASALPEPHPQEASAPPELPSHHCRDDHMVNMMFEVAKKKGVQLNFDVQFLTTEVSFPHAMAVLSSLVLMLSPCR